MSSSVVFLSSFCCVHQTNSFSLSLTSTTQASITVTVVLVVKCCVVLIAGGDRERVDKELTCVSAT